MTTYIFMFILSSIFSFCYSKAKDVNAQVVFFVLCFLVLFVPGAIRFGIGTDYVSYVGIFRKIEAGYPIRQEPAIFYVSKFLQYFGLTYKSLFVFYSFFSVLFVMLGIEKKYMYIGIPVYFVIFYLDSYCLLRQALACSILVYAYRKFFEKKYFQFFVFSYLAFLNHKIALLPVLFLFIFMLLPDLSKRNYMILLIIEIGVMFILTSSIINLVMNKLVPLTPYARYAINRYAGVAPKDGSGLGFFLKLFVLIILFYLIDKEVLSKKEYKIIIGLFFYNILVMFFFKRLYILVRLVNSISFVYIYFFIFASKGHKPLKKYLIIFCLMVSFMLFYKATVGSSINSPSVAGGGKKCYPYVSIFNYTDYDVMVDKKNRSGL